jgi:hypothetical protein
VLIVINYLNKAVVSGVGEGEAVVLCAFSAIRSTPVDVRNRADVAAERSSPGLEVEMGMRRVADPQPGVLGWMANLGGGSPSLAVSAQAGDPRQCSALGEADLTLLDELFAQMASANVLDQV